MINPVSKRSLLVSSLAALSVLSQTSCLLHRHANADLPAPVAAGEQPDKILYERALNEIAKSRYDVGRLTLQTLLNTYPDSEFLAKAKLAIADSYYNEGGMSGLTQAEAEYKDFITFFPTAPEAPESQLRAGMCHFRLMGKPDRDRTEARLAEAEFKEFLLKYPDSRLMPRVKARLREVQEVLGQSDYSIGQFYFMKQANRAARSRFQEIADSYPNFSQADGALWYLGQTLERLKSPNEAVGYYGELITDHPLSPLVDGAKTRLAALHQPIPHPTLASIARAQADESHRVHQDLLAKIGGVMSSSPDVSTTRHGPVHLGPKPGEVQVARAPVTVTGGNAIAVEQVGESSLNSGTTVPTKPADSDASSKPAPAATDSAQPAAASKDSAQPAASSQGSDKSSQAQDNSTKSDSASSPKVPSAKKKGRFNIFKKIKNKV